MAEPSFKITDTQTAPPVEVTPMPDLEDTLDAPYQQRREDNGRSATEQQLFRELGLDENGEPMSPATVDNAAPEAPPASDKEGVTAGAVVKDVGRGLVEIGSGRSIAYGVLNAVNEVIDLVQSVGDFMASKTGDIVIDPDGIKFLSPEEVQKRQKAGEYPTLPDVPNVDAPKSVTGNIASNVAQFLIGFKGADKLLKGVSAVSKAAKTAKVMAKGAVADFTVFDPYETNLSKLIQSNPELANPVNEFLATDPNDPEAVNRLRNSAEGLGFGVLADGFVTGLKAIRAARTAKREAIAAGKWSSEPTADVDATAFEKIGDPASNNLILYNKVKAAEGGNVDATTLVGKSGKAGKNAVQLRTDVPNQDWLQEQIDYAKEKGADDFGVPYMGKTTGTYSGNVTLPVDLLASIKGRRNEQNNVRPADLEWLTNHMRETGKLPLTESGKEYVPYIEVAHDGSVWVSEGNHRIMAAKALGWKTLPVEIRYFDGGERVDGVLAPNKVLAINSQQSAFSGFDKEININFAKIETGDDVKNLIAMMADIDAGNVEKARRGIRSWEATKLSAEQENAWALVSERMAGQAYNAEQLKAVKQLWVSTATTLKTATDDAFSNPSAANLAAFMRMQEVYRLVNREFMGAQAEAGRALNILRQPVGPNESMARNIAAALDEAGGQATVMEMVTRLKRLNDAGLLDKADAFVMKSGWAKSREAVAQVWINALLSNPVSHVANNLSGWATIGSRIAERRTAEFLSQSLGGENGVVSGETFALLQGLAQSFTESFSAAAKAARSGRSALVQSETGRRQGALSAETWNISSDTPVGMAMDYLDLATQTPGRMMQAGDEFFKSIGYRMELHAQATRLATQELHAGKITEDGFKTRIAEIVENPPENIHIEAVGEALYHTFTQKPAELPAAIANAWQRIPIMGLVTLPFKNTPINIMTYGFERTPLAPLVKSWREDVAAGGARAQMAMAKVSMGTMLMSIAMDQAMNGRATGQGPVDPQERNLFDREGKQRYSIKIGNEWVAFNRIEPMGTVFGLGADLVEIVTNSDADQESVEEAFAAAVFAAANAVTSKTYMQGMADLMQAISDSKRYGEGYVRGLVGATVPAGVAATARLMDPYMRQAWDIVDTIKRRTPGLSEGLPLRRDLWGRPISYKSGVGLWYDAVSPIYIKKENPEPVDVELDRLGYYPPMPDRKVTLRDPETFQEGVVDLQRFPHIYSRYVELAGNGAKDLVSDMGAKDRINALLSGNDALSGIYEMLSDGPEGGKAAKIREILSQHRQLAAKQLMEEFPELRVEVAANVKPRKFTE